MAMSRWSALRSVLFGGVAVLSINAAAAAQDTKLSLQEQPMSDALRSVAQKTGESILFTPESVEGLKAPAISGEMDARPFGREGAGNRRTDRTAAAVDDGVLALEQHGLTPASARSAAQDLAPGEVAQRLEQVQEGRQAGG